MFKKFILPLAALSLLCSGCSKNKLDISDCKSVADYRAFLMQNEDVAKAYKKVHLHEMDSMQHLVDRQLIVMPATNPVKLGDTFSALVLTVDAYRPGLVTYKFRDSVNFDGRNCRIKTTSVGHKTVRGEATYNGETFPFEFGYDVVK